ncbi:amino acid ABC transporter permease [Neosynechococcus sphagnicola sy1]|uniref:Amino acid ABC transporter permease n=1 Tax=Neosynechococcus sphagnicola sy1 TaxID=1497020 RepID=A0A098TRL0_9CYAN|nr:ABC transporter permease subunit [Neosynechococcus sphagnicola]KGF73443.1 amino acid ABC transporter permease [Neosynechococcus sphagnicola sy1]
MSNWKIRWWRDVRFWRWAAQLLAVLLLVLTVLMLGSNLNRNLQQLGLQLGFGFLNSQAGFAIGESAIPYEPSDPYRYALAVGLLNSLKIMVAGIVLATMVGVTVGIARLSDNWLVRQLALVYVEVLRNTPLLLQLFFWYFVVFLELPPVQQQLSLVGLVQLNNRGIFLPGNIHLSPEFSALLLGLTFYTGSFIAEIVRGAIQSVPLGQWEAARALGLKPTLIMRLVIFPQALQVMIPPLTSQYLNLIKNSSLAIAVGYPDVYAVASTTFNQTGRAVEVMLLLLATYLVMSLSISGVMNRWNHLLLHRSSR